MALALCQLPIPLGEATAFYSFAMFPMEFAFLQDSAAELIGGGTNFNKSTFNFDFSKDYSVRQRAYSTAQYSNNFTNNYQSFNGGGNLYAFGSLLGTP